MPLIHSALLLLGLALAVMLGGLALATARPAAWEDRRAVQLFALGAPLLVLLMLGGAIAVMLVRGCLSFTWWDGLASMLLLGLATALLATRGLGLLYRATRARRALLALARPAAPELRAEVARLASRLGVRAPRTLVLDVEEAIACTLGLLTPRILLSTGLLARLDAAEREAVLAHELAHHRHHDLGWGLFAAWLQGGLGYLPTVRRATRMLTADRELAADARAVELTRRPMALASALLKLQVMPPVPGLALADDAGLVGRRVEHLLAGPASLRGSRWLPGTLGAAALMLAALSWVPLWWMPTSATTRCLHTLVGS